MKSVSGIAAAIASVIVSSVFAEETDMIVACTQTANDYAWYLDHPDEDLDQTAKSFASLFSEDAVLKLANARLQPETFVGREQIAMRYKQGRDQMRFLHLIVNQRINATSPTTATGTSYVEVYIHPIGADMTHEFGLTGVAEYRSTFKYENGRCYISSREGILRLLSSRNQITDPVPEKAGE